MASPRPAFWVAWRRSLPARWRGLVLPYAQALSLWLAAYAGATALLRPWALGNWWALLVPLALGLLLCRWLWRPWALLATNSKGESRRAPLLLVGVIFLLAGHSLREYLYLRLGQVREVHHVAELARPGEAIFFHLRGPYDPDKTHRGRYVETVFTKSRGGSRTYHTTCTYACPLLASPADTTAAPPAWLGIDYQATLGTDLAPDDLRWRALNFGLRCDARFDTANLAGFAYLQRPETPSLGFGLAVQASRLPVAAAAPLLLPVRGPFAARGRQSLRLALGIMLVGSGVVIMLLLTMPLRPA